MSEYYKQRLLNETPEERRLRLEKSKIKNQMWKERFTPEQLKAIRMKYKERAKQKSLQERVEGSERTEKSQEYRERRRMSVKKCYRKKLMTETEEERQKRLELNREYRSKRQWKETEKQRDWRLEQMRKDKRKKRMRETEEERNKRLEYMRQYRLRRKGKHSSKEVNREESETGDDEDDDRATSMTKPGRCTKQIARARICKQLEMDDLSEEEGLLKNQECSSIQVRGSNVDKLKMKAVVLLERIHSSGLNSNLIYMKEFKNQSNKSATKSNESCSSRETSLKTEVRADSVETVCSRKVLVEKWGLRDLVVRLKRIDDP